MSDNPNPTEGTDATETPTGNATGEQVSTPPTESRDSTAPDTSATRDKSEPTSIEDFPAEAQRMIRELRNENAKERVNAKDTAAQEAREELIRDLGKALGYETDDSKDETPTVEDLTSQLESERDSRRYAILELEVYKAANQKGLDPVALLDSRSFMDSVRDLDPSGKDFSDSLTEVLDSAAKQDRYRTQGQVPPSSSSDHRSKSTSSSSGDNMSSEELADLVISRRGY